MALIWVRKTEVMVPMFKRKIEVFCTYLLRLFVWLSLFNIFYREIEHCVTETANWMAVRRYPMDRSERRNVKSTSRELFKRPANSTFMADTESIILPSSVSDSKIVLSRYVTPVSVLFRYPVSSNDDGEAIEVFELNLSGNLFIYSFKVVIRLMPNGLGFSKINIGSSSNLNRRDLV